MLTGKQRHYLRGLGHHLDAVVHMGKDGLTDGLVGAAESALGEHELIKVRLGENVPGDRHEVAESLAKSTRADLVQVLGRTVLIYKPRAEEPTIELP